MGNANTSRINGAKSQGPITPEGKARSAANSLRHGLTSLQVVLPHEDYNLFDHQRASYMKRFQPADQPEADLVETMVAARWRMNRVVGMENKIFEEEMVRHSPEAEGEFYEIKENEKLAWCFDHMANHSKSLQLLIRYEGSLNRTYERALKQLQALQKMRLSSQAEEIRNEPDSPGPSLCPQPNEPSEDSETTPEVPESAPETPAIPEPTNSGEPNPGAPAPEESN